MANLVTIARFNEPIEANLAKIRLASAEIPCVIIDDYTVGVIPHYANAIGGIRLQVSCEVVADAKAVLALDVSILDEEDYKFDTSSKENDGERILKPSAMLKWLSILFLVVSVVGFVSTLVGYLEYCEFESNGVVTKAEAYPGMYEMIGGAYLVDVQYYAGEKLVGTQINFSEAAMQKFQSGMPVKIRYLRDNPQKAVELRRPTYMPGILFSTINMAIGLCLLLAGYPRRSAS